MKVQTITRLANDDHHLSGVPAGTPDLEGTPAQDGSPDREGRVESRAFQPGAERQGLADVVELFPGWSDPAGGAPKSERRGRASELGMATAEYAIATLAAVGFAGVLVVLLRSEEVRSFLLNLIRTALALP
jgi:hypothetical protein